MLNNFEAVKNEIIFTLKDLGYGETMIIGNNDSKDSEMKVYLSQNFNKNARKIAFISNLNVGVTFTRENNEEFKPHLLFIYLPDEKITDKTEIVKEYISSQIDESKAKDITYNELKIYILCDSIKKSIIIRKELASFKADITKEVGSSYSPKLAAKNVTVDVRIIAKKNVNKNREIKISVLDRLSIYSNENDALEGNVYTARLYDIVNAYESIGESVFEKNIRIKIDDENDVDHSIKKTLESEPENFWFYNNGITAIVPKNSITHPNFNELLINSDGKTIPLQIINGAQTVSSSAEFFLDDYDDEVLENAKKAYVMFRVVYEKMSEKEKKTTNDVTISLNRQKPIYTEDFAYFLKPVEYINELNFRNPKGLDPFLFKISKRGEKTSLDNNIYDLEDLSRILTIIQINSPGKARSSGKRTLLKVANNGKFALDLFPELEEESLSARNIEKIFETKYKSVNFVAALVFEIGRLQEKLKRSSSENNEEYNQFISYSKYLITYCIYYTLVKSFAQTDEKINEVDFTEWKLRNEDARDYLNASNFRDVTMILFKNWNPKLENKSYTKFDSNAFKIDSHIIELAKESRDQLTELGFTYRNRE